MILTVTMNPSLDMAYSLPTLVLDDVNRVRDVAKTAGGKGLNVTRVLHQLGADVTATGLIGGHIGQYLTDQLAETGIQQTFYPIQGETRHSIAILHDGGQQTELLESGPAISAIEAAGFLDSFREQLQATDVLTISGSLPQGLPRDFYQTLIAESQGIPVLLDSSGASLQASLAGAVKPYLIKPNLAEIQELVGQAVSLEDLASLKAILLSAQFKGVEWIVISLGSQGAFAKQGGDFYRVAIPKIPVVNPVGSGDATLAGLAYGIAEGQSAEAILKTGMTTGMLNAQQQRTGWIDPADFEGLYQQIQVTAI